MSAFTRWEFAFLILFLLWMQWETAFASPSNMKAPWPGGLTFRCNQGNNGSFSHDTPQSIYAWDFGMPLGTPVVAADSGTVYQIGYKANGYGNYIVLKHQNGFFSIYGHLSEVTGQLRAFIHQGSMVGFSGSTGNSTGPHLHFSMIDAKGFSLPSQFCDIGIPKEGNFYTSANYPLSQRIQFHKKTQPKPG